MPLSELKNCRIILASQSPRRQFLLKELGIEYETYANMEVEEVYPDHFRREEIAIYLAELKSKAYQYLLTDNRTIIITADTIVWLDDKVLSKPQNHDDAVSILRELSGKKHEVITGVRIMSQRKKVSFHATTDVYFKTLNDSEISYYINNFKPYDKAGAYGVQEWIGYIGVERIDGSFFNVMGLPIQKVYSELLQFVKTL